MNTSERWWLWPLLDVLVWFHNRTWIRKHYQYFDKPYVVLRDVIICNGQISRREEDAGR